MTDHRLIAKVTEDLWACGYCGTTGSEDDLLTATCTHVYTPCKSCGYEGECRPRCEYSPHWRQLKARFA